MTAEELYIDSINTSPEISLTQGRTISVIIKAIKSACSPFKKVLSQPNIIKPLNENKLTQIFVEQIEVKIKNLPAIGVKNQYSDLFYGTKGIPDFYFHVVEEGVFCEPLFVVESKRLPSPTYQKEYVIGQSNNGGIERFKIEKHGKGLTQSGLLGFLEQETPSHWQTNINTWIRDLAATDKIWKDEEILSITESDEDYTCLTSIAFRPTDKIILNHFWVK